MSSAGTRAKLGPLPPPASLALVLADPQGRRDVLSLQDTLSTLPGMARSQPEMPAVQDRLHALGAGGLLARTWSQCEGMVKSMGALQGWGDWWLQQQMLVTGV